MVQAQERSGNGSRLSPGWGYSPSGAAAEHAEAVDAGDGGDLMAFGRPCRPYRPQAGIHGSGARAVEKWIPAFAGMGLLPVGRVGGTCRGGGCRGRRRSHAIRPLSRPYRRRPVSIVQMQERSGNGSRLSPGWGYSPSGASAEHAEAVDAGDGGDLMAFGRPCRPYRPQAGIHGSGARAVEKWIPAFAGMGGRACSASARRRGRTAFPSLAGRGSPVLADVDKDGDPRVNPGEGTVRLSRARRSAGSGAGRSR